MGAPAREAATSGFRCRAFRNGVLRRNPFVNATSPGMLLAATALIPLPPPSQDCISALIVQVGATGAAEQQAERHNRDDGDEIDEKRSNLHETSQASGK